LANSKGRVDLTKLELLKTLGNKRSSKWPSVKKVWLKENKTCVVCGGKTKLNVHHKKPFYLFPELELDPTNLITLCEAGKRGVNCHCHFGHIGDWKSYNLNVEEDSLAWRKKFKERPGGKN